MGKIVSLRIVTLRKGFKKKKKNLTEKPEKTFWPTQEFSVIAALYVCMFSVFVNIHVCNSSLDLVSKRILISLHGYIKYKRA